MPDDQLAGLAVARDNIDYAGRQRDLLQHLGKEQSGEGSELGRFQHDRVAGGECRSNLPGEHQQREIPWDDLAANADRFVADECFVPQLRPTGVMIEVTGDQWNVDVARFTNRFSVVQALQDGKQSGMLLDLSRDRIKIPGALVAGECRPGGERALAAATAAFTSVSPHWTRRASGLPSRGLIDSKYVSSMNLANSPLMNGRIVRGCSSSQINAISSCSGAGPYSIVSNISRTVRGNVRRSGSAYRRFSCCGLPFIVCIPELSSPEFRRHVRSADTLFKAAGAGIGLSSGR